MTRLRRRLLASLFMGPAWAEKLFWIVRAPEGNCTIVETEPAPTQTAIKILGRGGYRSREEAEADIDKVCN
jgi:hypothetical protein